MDKCKNGGIVKAYLFNASDWTEKDGGRIKRKYGKFQRGCVVYEFKEENYIVNILRKFVLKIKSCFQNTRII